MRCFGGTTTVGPNTAARLSLVASCELTRRMLGLFGRASFGPDMIAADYYGGFVIVENSIGRRSGVYLFGKRSSRFIYDSDAFSGTAAVK